MKKRSLLRYTLPFMVACCAMTSPATHSAPSFLRGSLGTLLTGLTCLVMQGRQSNASYAYFVNRSKEVMSGRIGNDMIYTSDDHLLVAQLYEEDKQVAFQKFDRDGASLGLVKTKGRDLQSVVETSSGNYIGVGTVAKVFTYQTPCGIGIFCTETFISDAVSIIFITPPNPTIPTGMAEISSYRAFGSVAGHKGQKIIKLNGGDYIVVGTNLEPSAGGILLGENGKDIVLARITESGRKVWLNRYFVAPSVFAFGAAPSKDSSADKFYIVGQHDASLFVGKVDADATTGDTEVQFDWKISVVIANGEVFIGSLRAHDVLETVDQNRVIVVGKHTQCCTDRTEPYERLFVYQHTAELDTREMYTLVYTAGDTYEYSTAAWSVKETSDNGFLITGERLWYENDDTSVLLMKIDTNLKLVFVRVYKEGTKNTGHSCLLTSDGRVYVTGSTTDPALGTPSLTTTFIGQWPSRGDGCGSDITSDFELKWQDILTDTPSGGNPNVKYRDGTLIGNPEEGLTYESLTDDGYVGLREVLIDAQKNVCIGDTDEPTNAPVPAPTRQPVSTVSQEPARTKAPTKAPTKSHSAPAPFTLTPLLLPVALTVQLLLRG